MIKTGNTGNRSFSLKGERRRDAEREREETEETEQAEEAEEEGSRGVFRTQDANYSSSLGEEYKVTSGVGCSKVARG